MPIFILSIFIQVALVIHIIKSGRNTTWIWVVVMLPLAGSIAYLLVELMPEFLGSRTGRNTTRSLTKVVNPNRDLKKAVTEFSISESTENAMCLAAELMANNMYDDAKTLYEKYLKGVHKTDPYIMFGLAQAEFSLGNFTQTRTLLDKLIEHNPEFKNANAHLLYARTLEALERIPEALHEYEVLHQYYPGPDATCLYAQLCQRAGKEALAQELFRDILKKAKLSGSHYRSLHKKWISLAKTHLNG